VFTHPAPDRSCIERTDVSERTFICEHCGVAFTRPVRPGTPPKYCTPACYVHARMKREATERAWPDGRYYRLPADYKAPSKLTCRVSYPACAECGRTFCSHKGSPMYCSDICREASGKRAAQERYRADIEANRTKAREYAKQVYPLSARARQAFQHRYECGWCKEEFVGHGRRKYCSDRCEDRANPYPGGSWNHKHLRRVADRDRWTCHLCGQKVVPGQESIDHLIPVSASGPNTMTNVALAHRRCNSRRGARGIVQLRLLG
jgi:HNH endonuclease